MNQLNPSIFFEEFSEVMQDLTIAKGDLVIVGDLNLHLDVLDDRDRQRFMELISSLGVEQLDVGPTHNRGRTLDVVISRESDSLVKNVRVLDFISDHRLIACHLNVAKPNAVRKSLTSRKFQSIIVLPESFLKDFTNSVLTSLLDKHAPSQT